MRLVYIQPVNAQLFKGDYIVLAACFRELFQSCFQTALGALHALDGKPFGMTGS